MRKWEANVRIFSFRVENKRTQRFQVRQGPLISIKAALSCLFITMVDPCVQPNLLESETKLLCLSSRGSKNFHFLPFCNFRQFLLKSFQTRKELRCLTFFSQSVCHQLHGQGQRKDARNKVNPPPLAVRVPTFLQEFFP